MRNQLVSIFLIWTILLLGSVFSQVSAQTTTKNAKNEFEIQNAQTFSSEKLKIDFNKSLNLSKTNVLDMPIDFDKIEKETPTKLPRRKMSGKTKAMWIAIVIGAAVGMFFLIKYAKECEIYESYCSPDEICPCLKYKEKTNE